MTPSYLLLLAVVLAGSALLLRLNLWRAVLVFAPDSVRVDAEDPPGRKPVPDALRATAAELERLGFTELGTHTERFRLGPDVWCWDYEHRGDGTLATLSEGRDGTPHLYFLSVLASDGYAITANHRRPAREQPGRYVSGWLEDIPPERVYKAHLRRTAGLPVERVALSLERRVDLQRAWYGGPGKSEVRQQHLQGLLWSVGTLGMVAAVIAARR